MVIEIMRSSLDSLPIIVATNSTIFEGMYTSSPYSLLQYQERLKGKNPFILVAQKNEMIVGDSISYFNNASLYLWVLGVLPEFRKKGVGSALLSRNETYALENGVSSMSVKVYGVSGDMRMLLERKGYKIIKRIQSVKSNNLDEYHYHLDLRL